MYQFPPEPGNEMADSDKEEIKNQNEVDRSESSDEDSPPRIKKNKSSTVRQGLARMLNRDQENQSEEGEEENVHSKYSIYSTKVARCLGNVKTKSYLLDMSLDDDDIEKQANDIRPICSSDDVIADVIVVGDKSDSADCSLLSDLFPSPCKVAAPKPTKKLQSALNILNRAKNLIDCDNLNTSLVLDSNTDIIYTGVSPFIEKQEILVKVVHKGKVHRINIKKSEPFSRVIEFLADKLELLASEIMLILGDRTISSNDTPNTIKLNLTDIIDCHIHSNSQASTLSSKLETDYSVRNGITLCVQSHSRNSKINITVDKMEPLSNLMEKYAADRKVNLSSLIFRFDGDEIDPNETPDDLELDNDYCIDAIEKDTVSVIVIDDITLKTKNISKNTIKPQSRKMGQTRYR